MALLYLVRRQLLNAAGITLFVVAMAFVTGFGTVDTIPDAAILAGLASGPYTWMEIARGKLWPFLDHFRVPRLLTLVSGSAAWIAASVLVRLVW